MRDRSRASKRSRLGKRGLALAVALACARDQRADRRLSLHGIDHSRPRLRRSPPGPEELTLVLVPFTDVARIDLAAPRRNYQLPVRLLAIGMLLSIPPGTAASSRCGHHRQRHGARSTS